MGGTIDLKAWPHQWLAVRWTGGERLGNSAVQVESNLIGTLVAQMRSNVKRVTRKCKDRWWSPSSVWLRGGVTNEDNFAAQIRIIRFFCTDWEHEKHTLANRFNNMVEELQHPETTNTSKWFCFPWFLSSVHSLFGINSEGDTGAFPAFKLFPVAQFVMRLRWDYWITNIPTCVYDFSSQELK